MELIVQIKLPPRDLRAVGAAYGEGGANPVGRVRLLAGRLGVTLAPLYPGTSDTTLATWYGAAIPDGVNAHAIVEELRRHADVESAYVKPQGAAP